MVSVKSNSFCGAGVEWEVLSPLAFYFSHLIQYSQVVKLVDSIEYRPRGQA